MPRVFNPKSVIARSTLQGLASSGMSHKRKLRARSSLKLSRPRWVPKQVMDNIIVSREGQPNSAEPKRGGRGHDWSKGSHAPRETTAAPRGIARD
ncbi:hypothetical protein CRG98_016526 [Punica granatum]|uniref:Uncharacterized protein n=1 Tax=Punica granatum TaxID=22663 RepID=A0A2I0K3E6_PUNGR|nr:hypothetical protein CRG98_016526 [Punica granatum]